MRTAGTCGHMHRTLFHGYVGLCRVVENSGHRVRHRSNIRSVDLRRDDGVRTGYSKVVFFCTVHGHFHNEYDRGVWMHDSTRKNSLH